MNSTLQIILAVFACTGFWEFLRFVIEGRRKKKTASEEGTMALLHEAVYPMLEECILRGDVGLEEFDRIHNLAQPYFRLGGNGVVKRRYDMVEKLPRRDDTKRGFYENED